MGIRENEDQLIEEDVLEEELEDVVEESDSTEEEQEPQEDLENDQDSGEDETDDEEEDRVITIGEPETDDEEEDPKKTPGWVKKTRVVNRKLESENKKLKKQLAELTKPVEETVKLGVKPTIASCGYDETKYDKALLDYDARKKKVEQQAAERQQAIEEQNKQWQGRTEKYASLRKEHAFKDFEEAEELVANTFNKAQQSIIIQGADDSALVIYALGKNPKKADELAKITNIVDFTFKVAKLEAQLKITKKKAPKPEARVKSGSKAGGVSGNGDPILKKLQDEADRTNDRSKVVEYMMKIRETQNG